MTRDERTTEIIRTLACHIPSGKVFEVRIIGEDGISSGYYDTYDRAAADIVYRESDPRVSGCYFTLNEVNPALLARRANRLKVRLGRHDATTSDNDIAHRWWLPIDIDPVRPSGVSSTDLQHSQALELASSIRVFLEGEGWPDPMIGDSGNGAHLLYPITLPNDEESRGLIRRMLEFLDARFSSNRCRVDTANFNAARIWKIYGTISRKGDHTPERPHRRSHLLQSPPVHWRLSASDLERFLCAHESPEPESREDTLKSGIRTADQQKIRRIDLGEWLCRHQITATGKPYQGGILYTLESCPFSEAHRDGAFAIQFSNGAIFAGCHHDSCGGGRQRWPELRSRYEPQKPDHEARLAKLKSDRIRERYAAMTGTSGEEKPAAGQKPGSSLTDHRHQAEEILSSGDPFTFLLETFSRYHEGDLQVAGCLIHSLISRTVMNSKGLHVSISGESGKGKSHAIETMKRLVPPEFCIEGRMSDKALFYMEELRPGSIITLDDVSLSEQMQEILKGVTSSFQRPFPYRTVNKDRKPMVCMIPQRCVWWIAKVEGAGDDQVFNRMLTCWIDDSEDQDLKVLNRTLAGAEEIPGQGERVSDEILTCRELFAILGPVWVTIPFARRIRFQSAENRRNPDMLLDLIRTHAAIHQKKRERREANGMTCVTATIEDFNQAARLFVALNGETGGQVHKLTKREAALIATFESFGRIEVAISRLQQVTGWSSSSICKLLHGYRSYGKQYSGLLEKCPAVSYLDRTVAKGDDGVTTMRRMRVYTWDPDLYATWLKGGSVWLAAEGGGERDPGDSDNQDPDDREGRLKDCQPVSPHDNENLDIRMNTHTQYQSHPGFPDSQSGCSLTAVSPHDYTRIEGFPVRQRCSVCGKGPVQFREKGAAGNPGQPARLLCSSCYHRAVSREAAARIPLPGLIHPERMVRLSSSVGSCHLCSLRPAAWRDPQTQTRLCDGCYHRERVKTGSDSESTGQES